MPSTAGTAPGHTATGYLALGDSYTIGEGVDPSARWPVLLADALRAEGIALEGPRIIATTGWTCDELDAGIDAAQAQAPLDGQALVSLLVGVNDQYRGRAAGDIRAPFAALLQRAVACTGGRPHRVLVLAIPDWGLTPFARIHGRDPARVAAQIDAFNAVAREESLAAGAHWIDIAPLYRAHGAEPDMLAADGLHPSAAMYALWAAHALPVARQALRG